MSDSEDDYMSNDFLAKVPDIKPGIAKNREHKRQLKIYATIDTTVKQLPRHELEAQRRHEALNKPVPETNKGFGLLAKMGYKPGMTIGKESTQTAESSSRLAEPIDLKLKLSRTGLGHDKVEQEKQQERCEAHIKQMQMQAKMSDILATDYRKRKRDNAVQRLLIADIIKSRKACQEMDLRSGIEKPSDQYLWPVIKRQEEAEIDAQLDIKRFKDDETVEWKYFYSNGLEALPEENLHDLSEDILSERLAHVTNYVRMRHFYCVWCGATYEDLEELEKMCPGPTKDLHNDD